MSAFSFKNKRKTGSKKTGKYMSFKQKKATKKFQEAGVKARKGTGRGSIAVKGYKSIYKKTDTPMMRKEIDKAVWKSRATSGDEPGYTIMGDLKAAMDARINMPKSKYKYTGVYKKRKK